MLAAYLGASAGALQTSVQQAVEGAWAVLQGLNVVVLTGWLSAALVLVSQAVLGQHTASAQQANAVGGRVVGQTNLPRTLQRVLFGSGHRSVFYQLWTCVLS